MIQGSSTARRFRARIFEKWGCITFPRSVSYLWVLVSFGLIGGGGLARVGHQMLTRVAAFLAE
jgi:hypothetical protein